ncbi:MAG: hypothetical protein ACRCV9_17900, partial [Burkholderiaceae bacterium]
ALMAAWFAWQVSLPESSDDKRADSTIAINRHQAKRLLMTFAEMQADSITKAHGYQYLDGCVVKNRAKIGNKEIALASTVFEWGVRRGFVPANPFAGIRKNKTTMDQRLVTDAELALAVEVGRTRGGSSHIVALALQAAYLSVRRPGEVLELTRDQIKDDGIYYRFTKQRRNAPPKWAAIEWSDALRACIDEALAIQRNSLAGSWYVFGNMQGQRYTKSGWKTMLHHLMDACVIEAQRRRLAFQPFNLLQCRPKGASDKLSAGQQDTQQTLGHTSPAMLGKHYDRRQVKRGTPVK